MCLDDHSREKCHVVILICILEVCEYYRPCSDIAGSRRTLHSIGLLVHLGSGHSCRRCAMLASLVNCSTTWIALTVPPAHFTNEDNACEASILKAPGLFGTPTFNLGDSCGCALGTVASSKSFQGVHREGGEGGVHLCRTLGSVLALSLSLGPFIASVM